MTTSLPTSNVQPAGHRARISLRPANVHDAHRLRQWRAEPSVREFQPLRDVSVAQLRADIGSQRMSHIYRGRGERFIWIIEADEVPCGWITLVVSNWEHGLCEIGYALSTDFHGRGVMTDSLSILVPELFFKTPLERIEARCAVGNRGSQRVLEKLGFRREGVLRGYFLLHGERVDHVLYGLLREDYVPV
ncbi:MAG: GNAT family protein [Acidobacteriota bacterium]